MRTVMFCFGGRRANMELQLPFVHRILDQDPDVEYHLWNLAKEDSDDTWIRSIPPTDRFRVINDFRDRNPWKRFNDVYRHYATDEYRDARFVKLDDDVVFIATEGFYDFTCSIEPGSVVSANVINNGACSQIDPELMNRMKGLRVGLLDVHRSFDFARLSHEYFFEHWETLLSQPIEDVPTRHWLSINMIGYDWEMGRRLVELLDTPSPRVIAGRRFPPRSVVGDEGAVNMVDRRIMRGFVAGHLTFGPQQLRVPSWEWDEMRREYAEIGRKYLETWKL